MRFSNDRATTVPSVCGQTIEKMQQDAAIKEFLKPHCGKFPRIYCAHSGYFPNKFIRLEQRQKLREITSLYNGRTGTGLATPGEKRSNRSSTHSL
jgi:hypothetical protein